MKTYGLVVRALGLFQKGQVEIKARYAQISIRFLKKYFTFLSVKEHFKNIKHFIILKYSLREYFTTYTSNTKT